MRNTISAKRIGKLFETVSTLGDIADNKAVQFLLTEASDYLSQAMKLQSYRDDESRYTKRFEKLQERKAKREARIAQKQKRASVKRTTKRKSNRRK